MLEPLSFEKKQFVHCFRAVFRYLSLLFEDRSSNVTSTVSLIFLMLVDDVDVCIFFFIEVTSHTAIIAHCVSKKGQ